MTRPQLLSFIRDAINKRGGIDRASGSWNIQPGNIKAVAEGRIPPGPRLQKLLGLTQTAGGEWVVTRKFAEDK